MSWSFLLSISCGLSYRHEHACVLQHAYDLISTQKFKTSAFLQANMKFNASEARAEAWAGLAQAQVEAAAAYQRSCVAAAKRGMANPPPNSLDPRALSFCQTITSASSAGAHTMEHAKKARTKM